MFKTFFTKKSASTETQNQSIPTSETAVQEAKRNPGGWVYSINAAAGYDAMGEVPPEAIEGAWKVDDRGEIIEPFIPNPNFDPNHRKPQN